jgi:uncharacterized membrane protein
MNTVRQSILIVLAMLAISLLALPFLPESVPTHWDINGQVDGYGETWLVAFVPVAGTAVLLALLHLLPRIDRLPKHPENARLLRRFGVWTGLLLLTTHASVLASALGLLTDPLRVIVIAEGLLLMLIGNEMGRLRPNSWAGIRMPWTLRDPDVFRRSNRMGGRLLAAAGLISVIAALTLEAVALFTVVTASVLISTVISVLYSYWIARRKHMPVNGGQAGAP